MDGALSTKQEGMNDNEVEQPLDLSSEHGLCDADKNSVNHEDETTTTTVDDSNDDDIHYSTANASSVAVDSEKFTEIENDNDIDNIVQITASAAAEVSNDVPHINLLKRTAAVALRGDTKEYSSESNRPLRKRKIIATEVSESQ
jgi:hypothetical protein